MRTLILRSLTILAPWPIVAREQYQLDTAALTRIKELTESWSDDEPALNDPEPYGQGVRCGWQDMPTLYLEDHRSIQLQSLDRASFFEYRSFGLSSAADVYLRSAGRVNAFEQYQREKLQIGANKVLSVDLSKHKVPTLAKACMSNSDHMTYLVARTRQAGGLNICPFIVDDDIWLLAQELYRLSDCIITVMGPTPRLATRANDKLWFFDTACAVLGKTHMPRTWRAYTLGAAVAELRYLAKQTPIVVLKTTSSAGSQGNLVCNSSDLLKLSEDDCHDYVQQRLLDTGWQDDYPLLIADWENPVQTSPSAQIWIPSVTDGLPIIEGLFTQVLAGDNAGFVGAKLATLPSQTRKQMVYEAGLLSNCLQQLGYFGRVSFDAIIVGENPEESQLHWIECNARWGGVSIPMTIANRLAGVQGYAMPNLRVIQKPQGQFATTGFADYRDLLGADLLNVLSTTDGVVCLTPVGEPDAAAALLILAQTDVKATKLSEIALQALDR